MDTVFSVLASEPPAWAVAVLVAVVATGYGLCGLLVLLDRRRAYPPRRRRELASARRARRLTPRCTSSD